ncbi:MAG: peptidyl-prolyl cis-trans isomerase [candidate division KSB1 bacterium]|nr:peptidyl-prolyl cis-trans isomerase [candidate division KSB1 bacterium]
MRFSRWLTLFFGVLNVVLFTSGCGDDATKLVARVGGRKITIQDFETEFAKGKSTLAVRNASLEEKKNFLNQLIEKQLKIIAAYQLDLHHDKNMIESMVERERDIKFNRLIEREVLQKQVTEDDIRDYHEKLHKEVKIRQIVAKFDPKNSQQKERALRRAKDIYQKLKNHEDFASLAEALSDDINTAKKGGDFGYLKWGPTSAQNPIYRAAFSMRSNDISTPIETEGGYYIIQVTDIKSYPKPSFAREKEKHKRLLYSLRNKELSDAYYAYIDQLRKKYHLQYNEQNIDLLLKKSLASKQNGPGLPDSTAREIRRGEIIFEKLSDNDKGLELVSFSGGQITMNDLIDDLRKIPPQRRPPFRDKSDVMNYLNNRLVLLQLLEKESRAQNISADSEVQAQIKAYRENIMLSNIQRLQVNEQVKVADEDVQKYFEEHREDYKTAETRNVQQIFVNDKKLAEKIVERARKGENFTKLFRSYNKKEALRKDEGRDTISRGRAGIGKPAFNVNVGDVTDPIPIGDGFFIVKVLGINPPTLQSFEEARTNVINDFRRAALKKREQEWLDELRQRFDVVIYDKNLEVAGKRFIGDDMEQVQ